MKREFLISIMFTSGNQLTFNIIVNDGMEIDDLVTELSKLEDLIGNSNHRETFSFDAVDGRIVIDSAKVEGLIWNDQTAKE